jgi:eukaryotic-like serine/threonine-protein kinase
MIGKQVAQYLIEGDLGAGGMGEVYQARDTRLGRSVALKMLPEMFARDPERVARFDREAKVLASLNHANIAALHGFEQADGKSFLVMELVEGATLADRIERGPIPVVECLKIAHQIADALESAHEKGIVHRDLKPANIKITPEGKVKVLDFGLAKALAVSPDPGDIMTSPTISIAGTNAGVILGTAPYMSPEQAKGANADTRSDIFSFGCVLFEMLSGRRSFQGDSVSEVIASVLAREPDLAMLPSNLSPRLTELLRRCLEKDQKRRWQAIGDVRVEIDAISADPHGLRIPGGFAAPKPLWRRALPAIVTGIVVAAITASVMWVYRPLPSTAITRFHYVLPKDTGFTRTGRHVVAISPDGANVVYVANQQLYLKPMADAEAKAIPGTSQDVNTPFFSPDGKWIGFFSVPENKLKKIAITGGATVDIGEFGNPFGTHWYSDGEILVGQGPKGILRVSANGGQPETVIAAKPGEVLQSPQMLPGRGEILFTAASEVGDDRWDKALIVAQSLKTGERKTLINGGSDARYVSTGHIVYALGANLFAVPFDAGKVQVTGGPVPIVEGVMRSAPGNTAATFFSFSDNGSLVSVPGNRVLGGNIVSLIDKSGMATKLGLPQGTYAVPRISPDGKQIAVQVNDGKELFISIYDLSGKAALRRLTFGGSNSNPLWTRDGKRIIFTSDRDRDSNLFWQNADGSGAAEKLTSEKSTVVVESASPDGKTITVRMNNGTWMMSLEGDHKLQPLIEPSPGTGITRSTFSPDGKWLAYQQISAVNTVFVQPFPPTGAKYQVTSIVSGVPTWSHDGKQIFGLLPQAGLYQIFATEIQTQPSVVIGKSMTLPVDGLIQGGAGRSYDITPDDKYFIAVVPAESLAGGPAAAQQISVVLNWFRELRERVPVK